MELKSNLIIFLFLFVNSTSLYSEAYDPLDPHAHIEIIWDVTDFTPDGYLATVRIQNHHKYRRIVEPPGWVLGWTWEKKEVIWEIMGAQAVERGDCSRFIGLVPHSCKKKPLILDLLPGTQPVANCCRGGVLSSTIQNHTNSLSMFKLRVGFPGANKNTTKPPMAVTLGAPGPGYTCSDAKRVYPPSKFWTEDRRRNMEAWMTWSIRCIYSQMMSETPNTCCVTLSSFYSDQIAYCPNCTCGCKGDPSHSVKCGEPDSPQLRSALLSIPPSSPGPLVQCTRHMCPIRVHWHIKTSYKLYWHVKVTIMNLNYQVNYSQWNLVLKHPNLENITRLSGLHYQPLINYGTINDSGMIWGLEHYNDLLMASGPDGNIQMEILFKKDKSKFTFKDNWAFPRKIYFNGDACVFPPLDKFPQLPNGSSPVVASLLNLLTVLVFVLVLLGYV